MLFGFNKGKHGFQSHNMIDIPLFSQTIEPVAIVIKVEQEPPKEKLYTIKSGDYLVKIAAENQTTLERIWAKNPDLVDPDLIEPNKQLKIPSENEELPNRPLPVMEPIIEPVQTPQSGAPASPHAVRGAVTGVRGNSAGNTYAYGYCTWGVKNWRPDLPNNLGNADTWYSRAAAQGFAVGSTPRVGAVAATKAYMHVAYVIGVNGNQVTIREMNAVGWNVVSTRTAPASEFRYIY